jgi:hypothetical protein
MQSWQQRYHTRIAKQPKHMLMVLCVSSASAAAAAAATTAHLVEQCALQQSFCPGLHWCLAFGPQQQVHCSTAGGAQKLLQDDAANVSSCSCDEDYRTI